MNCPQKLDRMLALTALLVVLGACGQTATPAGNTTSAAAVAQATTLAIPTSLTASTAAEASSTIVVAPATVPSATMTSPTDIPSAPPSLSTAPVAASGSALDAITKAYQATTAVKSYRTQSTITSEKTSITNTFELVLPDRLHLTTNINGRTSERIAIGSTTYARANGGAWVKDTSDSTGLNTIIKQFLTDPATLAELTKNITEAKLIGPDTLDGKPMTVYQYHLTVKVNDAGAQSSSVTKMWVGADNLPYKLVSDGSTNLTGKTTTSHITNVYSDYNAPITINAPIP